MTFLQRRRYRKCVKGIRRNLDGMGALIHGDDETLIHKALVLADDPTELTDALAAFTRAKSNLSYHLHARVARAWAEEAARLRP